MPTPLEYVGDGDWDTVRRNTNTTAAKLSPAVPQARVYNNANISITTSGVDQALTFNTERWDTGAMHSTSVNTGRLTAPVTGLYEVGCSVRFAANATGDRRAYLRVNGATIVCMDDRRAPATAACAITLATQYRLAATDYVEVVVEQDSGGALNVVFAGNYTPEFWMVRLAGYVESGL